MRYRALDIHCEFSDPSFSLLSWQEFDVEQFIESPLVDQFKKLNNDQLLELVQNVDVCVLKSLGTNVSLITEYLNILSVRESLGMQRIQEIELVHLK